MNAHFRVGFSGSYLPEDVTFLLQQVALPSTDVSEKERLIQTGQRHYSEMISVEKAPSEAYLTIFENALAGGAERMGREVAALALALRSEISGEITLASLVRAGAPLGVLLNRALRHLGCDVAHYGISIIRDRGLDAVALEHILSQRSIDGLVFVDGWTGKGAIATELETDFARLYSREARLIVLADPCGRAWLAASGDDWLIPSGILGSTVSGLISRSILNDDVIASGGFHGCMQWNHLQQFDLSQRFIETIWQWTLKALAENTQPAVWNAEHRQQQASGSSSAIAGIAKAYGVTNMNRIKPGIAEATRAVLRRAPERVFVSSLDDPDLKALDHLARQAGVPVEVNPQAIAPYRAITLIAKAD